MPWPRSQAPSAVVIQLLPAPEPDPKIDKAFMDEKSLRRRQRLPLIYQTGSTGVCGLPSADAAVSIATEVVRCFAGGFGVNRKLRRVKREAGARISRLTEPNPALPPQR
jgi:hypothetical protein